MHVLKSLTDDDMAALLARGRELLAAPELTAPAAQRLIGYADGDARRLLNAYENLVAMNPGAAQIDEAGMLEEVARCNSCACSTTRAAKQHFDTSSRRCIKSMRGSDPDAARVLARCAWSTSA